MTLVLLLFGLGVLCTLLWYCAVYALPLWAGFAVSYWALAHGAGLSAIAMGFVAGVGLFVIGHLAVLTAHPLTRLLALCAFVTPASLAGFSITWALSTPVVPSLVYRIMICLMAALAAGAAAVSRLTSRDSHGRDRAWQ